MTAGGATGTALARLGAARAPTARAVSTAIMRAPSTASTRATATARFGQSPRQPETTTRGLGRSVFSAERASRTTSFAFSRFGPLPRFWQSLQTTSRACQDGGDGWVGSRFIVKRSRRTTPGRG